MKKGWLWVLIGLGIGGWWGVRTPLPQESAATIATIVVISPTPGVPVRLVIPRLGVDTRIEQVGKDEKGQMGIPENSINAGWYSLGIRPGQTGNSVVDGHLNNPNSQPGIFFHLDKMQPGDEVIVEDETGRKRYFSTTKIQEIPEPDFPVERIFGGSEVPNLNLITCGGSWDETLGTYNKRVVVFTQLLQ